MKYNFKVHVKNAQGEVVVENVTIEAENFKQAREMLRERFPSSSEKLFEPFQQ